MPTWNSRGLRGSTLEDLINMSNDKYRASHLALVQKIPTPIKPINIDQSTRHITLAYFDQKSTVDYIGVVQGIPVCFDAKECATDTFPIQNIHEHQIEFMREFEKQDGISFIIIYFSSRDEFYYVPFSDIIKFLGIEVKMVVGKASHTKEINQNFRIYANQGIPVHYLETIQKDIELR